MDRAVWRAWFVVSVVTSVVIVLGVAVPPGRMPVSEAAAPLAGSEGPEIEIWLDPDRVPPGGCSILRWHVSGGDWPVSVDGQEVPAVGEREVCAERITTYELIVETPDGIENRQATLYVGEGPGWEGDRGEPGFEGPPVYFQVVDPEAIPRGACARLVWEMPPDIDPAWPVFLNDQAVRSIGDQVVCPEETTTYHLRIETPEGPRQMELTLRVVGEGGRLEAFQPEEPPPGQFGMEFPIEFVADPDAVPRGECVHLYWSVPDGDWPVMLDGRNVSHAGGEEVCPEDTRAYELLAEPPGGPKVARVTVQVRGEVPPEPPASQPGPQPTQIPGPQPQPQPRRWFGSRCPTYRSVFRRPAAGYDMGADHQQRTGHTEQQSRRDSGSGQAQPVAGGSNALTFGAKEFTLNLAPGQTQPINLGWPVDTSKNKYDLNVIVKVKDFTDPNSTNNGYQETIAATTAPGPGPQPQPGGKSGSDVAVTDLFPKNLPTGKVWTRITNHGPEALNNAQVELKCGGLGVDANGKTGWSHTESPKTTTVTLNPGQTVDIETDLAVDTSQYTYDLWCSVSAKSFNDPNQNNNKYSEKISSQGGPQPVPPPGGSSWGATKADLAVTDIFPRTSRKARCCSESPTTDRRRSALSTSIRRAQPMSTDGSRVIPPPSKRRPSRQKSASTPGKQGNTTPASISTPRNTGMISRAASSHLSMIPMPATTRIKSIFRHHPEAMSTPHLAGNIPLCRGRYGPQSTWKNGESWNSGIQEPPRIPDVPQICGTVSKTVEIQGLHLMSP